MPRTFVKLTKEQLEEKLPSMLPRDLKDRVAKDMKVGFDMENPDCPGELTGFQTLENGLTFLGHVSGGDWEFPVFWIVYHDGAKVRGYIPTEGNPWCRKTKQAFGNNQEEEVRELKKLGIVEKDIPDDEVEANSEVDFDWAEIKKDILGRFEAKA